MRRPRTLLNGRILICEDERGTVRPRRSIQRYKSSFLADLLRGSPVPKRGIASGTLRWEISSGPWGPIAGNGGRRRHPGVGSTMDVVLRRLRPRGPGSPRRSSGEEGEIRSQPPMEPIDQPSSEGSSDRILSSRRALRRSMIRSTSSVRGRTSRARSR